MNDINLKFSLFLKGLIILYEYYFYLGMNCHWQLSYMMKLFIIKSIYVDLSLL